MGLGSSSMTPGEAAGIFIEGRDPWCTLIQNAAVHSMRAWLARRINLANIV